MTQQARRRAQLGPRPRGVHTQGATVTALALFAAAAAIAAAAARTPTEMTPSRAFNLRETTDY